MYRVHGVHLTPIPQRHVSQVELDEEEESLEDFVVWFATTRPSGAQCSVDTIKKYVSSIRAFLFRTLHRVFGHGAAGSIIPGCNVSLTFSTETISTALLKCKVREALRLLEARLA